MSPGIGLGMASSSSELSLSHSSSSVLNTFLVGIPGEGIAGESTLWVLGEGATGESTVGGGDAAESTLWVLGAGGVEELTLRVLGVGDAGGQPKMLWAGVMWVCQPKGGHLPVPLLLALLPAVSRYHVLDTLFRHKMLPPSLTNPQLTR